MKAKALVGATVICPHCNNEVVVPLQGTEAADDGAGAQAAPASATADSEDNQEPDTVDSLASGLALYLPSWGTSVVFHAALILLCIFMVWQIQEIPTPVKVTAGVVKDFQVPRPMPQRPAPKPGAGKVDAPKPGVQPHKIYLPSRTAGPLGPIAVPGTGVGEWGGGGGGEPGGGGIFTPPVSAHRIVYVIDRSGSMTDLIELVKLEMKKSLKSLTEKDSFHVIFYSTGPAVELPTKRLVPATSRNRQTAFEFIDGITPAGLTDPSEALERAFVVKPELIYLLTDGEFDRGIIGLVARLNQRRKTVVHTIGLYWFLSEGSRTPGDYTPRGEDILKEIAKNNDGTYRRITEADFATETNSY